MKKKLKTFFKKNSGKSFKRKEIARKLNFNSEHEYQAMKSALYQLEQEGFVVKSGKRYKLNTIPETNTVVGKLEITNAGYGFVVLKNSNLGDIFIAARNLGTAFNGDVVEAALFAQQKGKNLEGQIINVVERKRNEIIGTLKKSDHFYFVVPDEPEYHRDIYIEKADLNGAKINDKVVVGNFSWDANELNPEGEVIEVIGKAGSLDTEAASIAREFELPYKFDKPVKKEAEKAPERVSPKELKGRIDFRKKTVFTIDPEDAKDFDDALSIEKKDNGNFSVGIHIADVSNYVQNNMEMDKEARNRGNSVYLVGRVIPMLPEKLSNNICSLVPNKVRLTYSVIAELTKRGRVVKYDISKSVIKSKKRFTYEEAQNIIEKKKGKFSDELLSLNKLAQTLRKKRMKEGSIDFFTPEVKFDLDEEGIPKNIERKEIKESNQLVEEFMLLANRIVAKHIAKPKSGPEKPFVYRVHDLPDKEKIFEFSKFVKSLGYSFDPGQATDPKQFQQLMQSAKGTEEEAVINQLAIRSMAKAVYSPQNIGHYGLGFEYYSHFTSPIRRYADLIVHRLLNQYLNNKKGSLTFKQLDEISEHISQTERKAIDAERYSVKLKQIEYLQGKIGEEFNAVVSGVQHFGLFVETTDILAEGLVKVRDLEGDFYVYDEKKYSLIGKHTNKQYRLGDKVKVQLIRVDTDKSELDFVIV